MFELILFLENFATFVPKLSAQESLEMIYAEHVDRLCFNLLEFLDESSPSK